MFKNFQNFVKKSKKCPNSAGTLKKRAGRGILKGEFFWWILEGGRRPPMQLHTFAARYVTFLLPTGKSPTGRKPLLDARVQVLCKVHTGYDQAVAWLQPDYSQAIARLQPGYSRL